MNNRPLFEEELFTGVRALAESAGQYPIQCFTIKMPLPLYVELKKEVLRLKREAKLQTGNKRLYTMSAFVNAAVQKVILPVLRDYRIQNRAA